MLIIYHITGLVQHDFIKSETLLGFEVWISLHCVLKQDILICINCCTRLISSEAHSHVVLKKESMAAVLIGSSF